MSFADKQLVFGGAPPGSPWGTLGDFAYLLAKAYDDGRHLFRETLLPYAYDSRTVADRQWIPLHPGVERYYHEMGYLQS